MNNPQQTFFGEELEKTSVTQRRFFFHYNKPESKKQDKNVLTVHWKNSCIPVNDIKCSVALETHSRTLQPRCVMRGWADNVTVTTRDGTTLATIS